MLCHVVLGWHGPCKDVARFPPLGRSVKPARAIRAKPGFPGRPAMRRLPKKNMNAFPSKPFQWSFRSFGLRSAAARVVGLVPLDAHSRAASLRCALLVAANLVVALGVRGQAANATPPRLVNISSRAYAGEGAITEIAGFVVSGPPGSTEQVLVRGIGPSLSLFGVSGVLATPTLTLYDSKGIIVAANAFSWAANSNFAQIVEAEATTGAFPLGYTTLDAAVLVNLGPGNYTAHLRPVNYTAAGVGLAEIYEVSSAGAQIVNISTRAYVGTGSNVEIAGIVITGSQPATVLVRAVGPALGQFGVAGVLAIPSLSVVDASGGLVGTNTGWSNGANPAAVAAASATVGAFPLTSGSADCALLLTLQPGSYTAVVSGVGGTSGVALVEAYQVP